MEEMFIQTDEQRAILESVKRFVADVVTPKAPALDAMTDGKSLLAQPQSLAQDYLKAHSLAMPLGGKSDSGGFVSSYGNSITIPGPGIDQPAPAWALSPGAISLH